MTKRSGTKKKPAKKDPPKPAAQTAPTQPPAPPAAPPAVGSDLDRLDVPVRFGNLSVGEDTARLGIRVSRSRCTLRQAEHFLCGSRLELSAKVDPNADNDTPGQTTFDSITAEHHIDSVVDVKGYGGRPKNFTAGMTFSLAEIDVRELASFAGRSGRVRASRVGAAGEKDGEAPDVAGQQVIPGTTGRKRVKNEAVKAGSDEWREVSVDELEDHGLGGTPIAKLHEHFDGKATLGKVADFTDKLAKRITDIKGIGKAAAEKYVAAVDAWFKANPTKAPAVKGAPKREKQAEHILEWSKGAADGEIVARSVWEKEDKTPLRYVIFADGKNIFLTADRDLITDKHTYGADEMQRAKDDAQMRENQVVANINRGLKPEPAKAAEPPKGGGVPGSATVGGAIAHAAKEPELSDETVDRGARLAITAGKASTDLFVNQLGLTRQEAMGLLDHLIHLKAVGDHIEPPKQDRHVLMSLTEWEAVSPLQPQPA